MEALLLVVFLAAIVGLLPASIAASKGRTFTLWWIYGAALFIIALPHALLTSRNDKVLDERKLADGMRKCPSCAELVKAEATVCRFCQRDLPAPIAFEGSLINKVKDQATMDQYGITFDGSKYVY